MDVRLFLLLLGSSFFALLVGFIFNVTCSRWNYPVYFPRLYKREVDSSHSTISIPKSRSNLFWIKEALQASEEELLDTAGVDAVVYIALLEAASKIVGYTAIYSIPVLIKVTYGSHPPPSQEAVTFFDLYNLNCVPDRSPRIWAFVGSAYWQCIVTCWVLWWKYKQIANLRAKWLAKELRPHEQAVLMTKIPLPVDGKSYEDQVNQYCRELYPNTFVRSIMVFDIRKLKKIHYSLMSAVDKLDDARLQASKSRKLGIKSCFKGVNDIQSYENAVEQLNKAYQAELEEASQSKQRPAAFLIFNNPITAALAARATYACSGNEWRAFTISDFRGIVWRSFDPFRTKLCHVVKKLSFTLRRALLSAVPLGVVLWFLQNKTNVSSISIWAGLVTDLLPSLIFKVLFEEFLPQSLSHILKLTNIASRTALQRYGVDIIFAGVIIVSIADVILWQGDAYTAISFFMTFMALGTFRAGYRLMRVATLVRYRFLSRSKSEQDKACAPEGFDYLDLVPRDLFVLVIALCYASMGPLVLPSALISSALGLIITRYEALKVKLPSCESGGRMWPHLHKWILAALLTSQFLLILRGFKHFGFAPSLALAPLPFLTVAFGYVSHKRFSPVFCRPLLEEIKKLRCEPLQIDDIAQAFNPSSSMQEELSQAMNRIKYAAQETEKPEEVEEDEEDEEDEIP